MDLMSLRYFQFVAMYRNFSKAAEHFYIGQPALSRQIANLEKELGVQLFVRDTRNVSLTDAGTVLYEQCGLLLRHFEMVQELLDATKTGRSGNLTIATVAHVGSACPELIQRFITTYPDVNTQIDDIPFDDLPDSIAHGVYDVAITLEFAVPENDMIAIKTIGHDRLVAVMRDDSPFATDEPISLAQLCEMPLIIPHHTAPPILRRLRLMTQSPNVQTVPNTATAMLRVDLGMGVSIIPACIAKSSFMGPRIRYREFPDSDAAFAIVAIYRTDNHQQTLRNFLALIHK